MSFSVALAVSSVHVHNPWEMSSGRQCLARTPAPLDSRPMAHGRVPRGLSMAHGNEASVGIPDGFGDSLHLGPATWQQRDHWCLEGTQQWGEKVQLDYHSLSAILLS